MKIQKEKQTKKSTEKDIQLINNEIENVTVGQRIDNGYINATALCRACGKQIKHYLENATTKAFLSELSSEVGIPTSELIVKIKGFGVQQGTWVHPQVAINLGQWASPKFAVAVSKWVLDWMSGKQPDLSLEGKSALQLVEEYQSLKSQIDGLEQKRLSLRAEIYRALGDETCVLNKKGQLVASIVDVRKTAWRKIVEHLKVPAALINAHTSKTPVLYVYRTPKIMLQVKNG